MKRRTWILVAAALAAIAIGVGAWMRWPRDDGYSQATPDAVIATMVKMIKAGDVRRLPELVYDNDSREMRIVLRRVGDLFDSLQTAAKVIAARFPAEAAKLRQETIDAAASGTATAPMAIIAGLEKPKVKVNVNDQGHVDVSAKPGGGDAADEDLQRMIVRVLADPFGWIDASAGRITTVKVSEDVASVLVDGKPFAGVGLPMRKVNGRWYVALPTALVEAYMPRSRDEWSIVASLVRTVENAVRDVTADVHNGKIASLTRLAQVMGEKSVLVALPALMYAKEMEVRRLTNRSLNDLKAREKAWAQAREDAGQDAAALERVINAVNAAALNAFDAAAREHAADNASMPMFAKMSDAELVTAMEGWLTTAGVRASLAASVSAEEAERIAKGVEAWKAAKAAGTKTATGTSGAAAKK